MKLLIIKKKPQRQPEIDRVVIQHRKDTEELVKIMEKQIALCRKDMIR